MRASSIETTPVLEPGTTLSHYQIIDILGQGGMGVVYRAQDLQLDREVAIKCVRPDKCTDRSAQLLRREARAASRLSHPSIVKIFDVLDFGGLPAVVMELIDGVSLRRALQDHGPMPIETVAKHAQALAEALAYAHKKGILHRDISPGNVIISREGQAMLTDFGLAGRVRPQDNLSTASTASLLTLEQGLLGTPGYMSPDQLLGRSLDRRSDIFSLGVVLYEMCTAIPAFEISEKNHLDAVLNREPTAIVRLNYSIPHEFERIVRKAMAKRPDERFQSALDMASDLRAFRRVLDSDVHPSPVPIPGRTRRLYVVAALALLAIGLVPAIVWAYNGFIARPPSIPLATPHRVTADPALEKHPAISPDGSFVAYSSARTGDVEIWLTDVSTGRSLQLTHSPGPDHSPAWFPDGARLAFVSERSGENSIWRIPRLGGDPALLIPDAASPAISPDEKQVAFVRQGDEGSLRIWTAPLADPTSAVEISHDPNSFWAHDEPNWSPDGNLICYATWEDLWLVPATGGIASRLTPGQVYPSAPTWSTKTGYIYFSAESGATRALWRITQQGSNLERLTLGTSSDFAPSVSRDGRRLAYSTDIEQTSLVLHDLAGGGTRSLTHLPLPHLPVMAASEPRVFFLSTYGHKSDLYSVSFSPDLQAVDELKLTDLGDIGTFTVSPAGDYIAYHRVVDGSRDIWVRKTSGGVDINLTGGQGINLHPAWSPDGKRLAFVSTRDGQQGLWVLPIHAGASSELPSKVTPGDSVALLPTWSPDSRQLAYLRMQEGSTEVWIVSSDGKTDPEPATQGAQALATRWSRDADWIWVTGYWNSPGVQLMRVNIVNGTVTGPYENLDFGDSPSLGDFFLSSDETLIVYVKERHEGDVWLMEASEGRF